MAKFIAPAVALLAAAAQAGKVPDGFSSLPYSEGNGAEIVALQAGSKAKTDGGNQCGFRTGS